MKPHPHKDVIIAYANGAQIERWDTHYQDWKLCLYPDWDETSMYRVKQKKLEISVDHHLMYLNLRFTVEKDGPLMRITDVELIK